VISRKEESGKSREERNVAVALLCDKNIVAGLGLLKVRGSGVRDAQR